MLRFHDFTNIHFLLGLSDKRLVSVVSSTHPTLRTAAELRANLERRLTAGHEYVAFDCATPTATGECPGHKPFVLIPVEPVGSQQSPAFVDGRDKNGRAWGGMAMVTSPIYPASPWGAKFRAHRQGSGSMSHVTIGDAHRRLGIGLAQVSALESGALTLESDEEWERAMVMLRPEGGR